ncbi:hypothetical protein [Polaribacter cellanae]|uniref:Uncharacterized protein n=1 Tax=Polaribacter cellanae TaxID=2818493 RepID=A0A975CQF6_9FLAO|nr:hypothetical protein [Polaribacter cellanae]QTE23347.1 hypothetical protein J3359_03445 [Polaribacter cellanae]
MLSEFASQAGASLSMGDNITLGTVVGSIAGGLVGGKLPKWKGVKGGWLKNTLGEIGFNSARGAIRGSATGGVGALIDGGNIGKGIANGAKNGAIGGGAQSIAMIAAFGATYKPSAKKLEYVNRMAKATGISAKSVNWRKGGIYQGIMSLLDNKREVTWGNNVATFNKTDADVFGHEFGHIIQVRDQGWAIFQAKGIYEQLILGSSSYGKFETNEYGAEKYLHTNGGCSMRGYCPVH